MNTVRKPNIADVGASFSLLHDALRTPKGKWAVGAVILGLATTGKLAWDAGEAIVSQSQQNAVYDVIQADGEGALAAFDHGEYRGLKVAKVTPEPGQTLMGMAATVAEEGNVESVRNLGAKQLSGADLQGQPLVLPEEMVQDPYEDRDQRPSIDKLQP